uniref:Uncharacterized protein n=1 Tax=Arundo donax TaxID=35708 RepID=A0A0A9CWE0_ARUDO
MLDELQSCSSCSQELTSNFPSQDVLGLRAVQISIRLMHHISSST